MLIFLDGWENVGDAIARPRQEWTAWYVPPHRPCRITELQHNQTVRCDSQDAHGGLPDGAWWLTKGGARWTSRPRVVCTWRLRTVDFPAELIWVGQSSSLAVAGGLGSLARRIGRWAAAAGQNWTVFVKGEDAGLGKLNLSKKIEVSLPSHLTYVSELPKFLRAF
jgi:hypothetical protein